MGFLIFLKSLLRSLLDERTSNRVRIIFAVAIIYILSPIDIISDIVPLLGLVDDGTVSLSSLAIMRRMLDDEVYDEYHNKYKDSTGKWMLLFILGFFIFWAIIVIVLINVLG